MKDKEIRKELSKLHWRDRNKIMRKNWLKAFKSWQTFLAFFSLIILSIVGNYIGEFFNLKWGERLSLNWPYMIGLTLGLTIFNLVLQHQMLQRSLKDLINNPAL